MVRVIVLIFIQILFSVPIWGQKSVAITVDDVPNTRNYDQDHQISGLLTCLDSMDIPVAIFINEGKIYETGSKSHNQKLLEEWVSREYVTVGNHTYSHSRYSEVGLNTFAADIEKGEVITRKLARKYQKPIQWFRFPYNDLGIDSVQHAQIDSVLRQATYKTAPFTIESSDWMFNAVYEHYLALGKPDSASIIGEMYVAKTLETFTFFDSLSTEIYHRQVKQIYLCHDNPLNAKYLPTIIQSLKNQQYDLIDMNTAYEDPVY
jgi:peptidoglycan/xylan/chitin deacetylase (PgdA/CDA1 family)